MSMKIYGVGNLTADPELGHDQNGGARLKWRMAFNGRKDQTTYVSCVLFGKRAESLYPHLAKGQRVMVDGRLEVKEGQSKTFLDVIVNDVEFAGERKEKSEAPQPPPQGYPPQGQAPQYPPQYPPQGQAPQYPPPQQPVYPPPQQPAWGRPS